MHIFWVHKAPTCIIIPGALDLVVGWDLANKQGRAPALAG